MRIPILALRNLSRQKRRSFLLGGALAFGFLVLTLVNGCAGGVAHGFETNVSVLSTGHLYYVRVERNPINGKLRLLIPSEDLFLQALERSGVETRHVIRRTQALGLSSLIFSGKTTSRPVEGIDWENDLLLRSNLSLARGSLDGLAGSDGVVIAESVAKTLGVDVGDRLLIQTLTIDGQQNVDEFEVRAIYRDTAGVFQVSIFVDREALNRLIGMPQGSFNTVGVYLPDIALCHQAQEAILDALRALVPTGDRLVALEELRQKDFSKIYQDLRKDRTFASGAYHILPTLVDQPFFRSFQGVLLAVKWGSALVVYFLMVLIMTGLVNTFRLIVQERRREIGTLRALGMHREDVQALFLWEAALLSLLGASVGFVLGLILLWLVGLGENLWFLPDVGELAFFLIDRKLSWRLDIGILVVSTLILVLMTLTAAWLPARRAARLQPAEALRQ